MRSSLFTLLDFAVVALTERSGAPHAQPTLPDKFSDAHRLYVAEINAPGLLVFPALYLPWWI